MNAKFIAIAGAKTHNLKNIAVEIPKHQFVVDQKRLGRSSRSTVGMVTELVAAFFLQSSPKERQRPSPKIRST